MQSFLLVTCVLKFALSYNLNATGATFPATLYQEATFSYQFIQTTDVMSYFATGSGGGKCNIMGYWHTSNTNPNAWQAPTAVLKSDQNICTDKCSATSNNCNGYSAGMPQRWDKATRNPIMDIGASDGLMSAADYAAFPDLQMFPAVAGAVVPIYNIPELKNISGSIILTRNLIANIFIGNVRFWNDPSILAVQIPSVRKVLSTISEGISVVVRTDSSGTTDIFAQALSFFQPSGLSKPDYSFSAIVGLGQTPTWCGPKTDEIQIITTTLCNSNLTIAQRTITLQTMNSKFRLASIMFPCDAPATTVQAAFETVFGKKSMIVYRSKVSPLSYAFTVGYFSPGATNTYEPFISSVSSVGASITTLQEGGFLNVHYNSSYSVLSEVQSIFLNGTAGSVFTISNPNVKTSGASQTIVISGSADKSSTILSSVNALTPGLLSTVVRTKRSGGLDEYKLTFASTKSVKSLVINPINGSVVLLKFQRGSNFPLFYDSANPHGYSGSGKYTCYRRDHNLTAWSYYAGSGTLGVIAEVNSHPYAIGYGVLGDAQAFGTPMANMINFAGNVIQPNSTSVTYAVMEKGGSLDSRFNALISDGKAAKVWPIAGYTYFLIRTKKHFGSCDQRRRAMQFLLSFYHTESVVQIAESLGFSTLPSFIRDIVVSKLKSVAMCSNGEFAFNFTASLPLSLPDVLLNPMTTYQSAYYNVDPSYKWNVTRMDNSVALWNTFVSNPNAFVGVGTVFVSKSQKVDTYAQGSSLNIITTAFAHFAVTPIYNLVSLSTSTTPLRLTPEILVKIYSGAISYWNDSAIKAANPANSKRLPYQPIIVVYRSTPSDVNRVFTRYLALQSPAFQAQYSVGTDGIRSFDVTPYIPKSRLVKAPDNEHTDSFVTFFDGSIGYYAQVGTPNSPTAMFCPNASCSTVINPTDPANLARCETDPNVAIKLPSGTSYDLMMSTAPYCYPIAATIDYSFLGINPASACLGGATGIANRRVAFNSWLYNGTALTAPLTALAMQGTASSQRSVTYNQICDITCDGKKLGYMYCGYRDCAWDSQQGGGDYRQVVGACKSDTGTRTVSYVLTPGNLCIKRSPLASVEIDCDYLPRDSPIGIGCYVLLSIGTASTLYVIMKTLFSTNDKIQKADPAFVYVFLIGAVIMHVVVIPFIGPITSIDCIAEKWMYPISLTLMYGPLVIKMTILDAVVTHHVKVSLHYAMVLLRVAALVVVDIIILGAWMAVRPPYAISVQKTYDGVLAQVTDLQCDADMNNPFVLTILAWKIFLMGFGLLKAVSTWNVASSVATGTSDSKQFAVALGIGVLSYTLSVFLNLNAMKNVLLQCVCCFICSVLSVFLIMLPKLSKDKKEVNLDAEVAKKLEKQNRDTLAKKLSRVVDASKQSVIEKLGLDKKEVALRRKINDLPTGVPTKSKVKA